MTVKLPCRGKTLKQFCWCYVPTGYPPNQTKGPRWFKLTAGSPFQIRVMTFLQAVCVMNSLLEVMMASCSTDTSPHQGHGLVSSSSVWISSMSWQFFRVWIAKAWKRLKQETNKWRNFVFLYTPPSPQPALWVHFGTSAQPSPTVHPTQVFFIFKFFQDECLPCYVANGTQRLTFLEPLTTDQSSWGWLQSSHVTLLYPNWCVCPKQ